MKEINEWADFWRYDIGVNVIPANSINKKTWVSWKEDARGNWQIEPIPEYIHNDWKKNFTFKDGMAIICGDRKSTCLNSSHEWISRMPSSA